VNNQVICGTGSSVATYGIVYQCQCPTSCAWVQIANLNGPTGGTGATGGTGGTGATGGGSSLPSCSDGGYLAWDTGSSAWVCQLNPVYAGTGTQSHSGTGTVTIGASSSTLGSSFGTSVGNSASATGARASAYGNNAKCAGADSFCAGSSTVGTYQYSIVMGHNANDGGAGFPSVVVGAFSKGTEYSAVLGQNATCSSIEDVCIGYVSSTSSLAEYGVAVGSGSEVTGLYGTAVGGFALANANYSSSFGLEATCGTTGTGATAIGSLASSTGIEATAVGQATICNALNGACLGAYSTVSTTGLNAAAVGFFAQAKGNSATGVGSRTIANADYCTAIGSEATCSTTGTESTAVGRKASATGTTCVSMGFLAVCDVANGVAVGQHAITNGIAGSVSLGSAASPVDTAHAFALAVNSLSVLPGAFGLTVNGASFQQELYTSQYNSFSATTLTLSVTSAKIQIFQGGSGNTLTLPVASTLKTGFYFWIINYGTGNVVINTSGATLKISIATKVWGFMMCILASGTGTASWVWMPGGTAL